MDYEGKLVVRLLEEKITGEKLRKLIDFCFNISDTISLNSLDPLQMLASEIDEQTKARDLYWAEERRVMREQSDEEEDDDEYEQDGNDEDFKESIICAKSEQVIEEFINEKFSQYDFIKREVTFKTHCTVGPLTTVYYFKTSDSLKQKFKSMENLFECIVICDKNRSILSDPAFYKGENLVCSICSHEAMGSLVLEEAEYDTFRKLRIPHQVLNQEHTWSLEEWLEECAYQEHESLTIHGWTEERIPEQLGNIQTLKELQIFDHQVKYLPRSLEKLTELECLRITGNKVESLDFDIAKLKKLKTLDLCGMPLKEFPQGILELNALEKVYLGDIKSKSIPKELMKLEKLQVLSLPSIEEDELSPEFAAFIRRLQPKPRGISLRDVLGEEMWKEIEEKGDYIMGNF